MFTKLKVTQSMVDAVNKVLDEASAPIKEPTSTGMKVYGRSYGNSAKAKQDQTKSSVDDLKGPKTKELMQKDKEDYVKTKGKYDEAAKPDYLDFDKDGNKAEPMKKALGDKKKVAEELKGDQHKIDANKNKKIDAHDFAILRGKKKVKESFSVRLEEKWKSMKEKKDVVMPEALEKSPEKNQDVADKSHLKDKPGSFKSDLKNLGRFLTGKKETNEEVEQIDELVGKGKLPQIADYHKEKSAEAKKKMERIRDTNTKLPVPKEKSAKIYAKDSEAKYHSNQEKRAKALMNKEEVESLDEKNVPTSPEKWAKAKAAAKSKFAVYPSAYANGWASKKYKAMGGGWKSVKEDEEFTEEQLDEMINEVLGKDATAGDWISDFIHSDNPKFAGKSKAKRKEMALAAYYGKQRNEDVEIAEVTIAGTSGWKKIPKDVKDKSGAIHTPMSRAKNLAHSAFKKVQDRTKISKQD